MVISILGCGWYGKAVGKLLAQRGFIVKGSVTSEEKFQQLAALNIAPYLVNIEPGNRIENFDFFTCDVLIISIPPKFRQGQAADYLPKIKQLAEIITHSAIPKVIYISSTRVYGDVNKTVNEMDYPIPTDNQGSILLAAEAYLSEQSSFKTTIIRFAGLVGPGRNPGRFFSGKTAIPNGNAPVNLIHLKDCIGITEAIIDNDMFGYIFNASSPHHPTKTEFYTAAAKQQGLPVPHFIDEVIDWKIVECLHLTTVLHYEFKIAAWTGFNFED